MLEPDLRLSSDAARPWQMALTLTLTLTPNLTPTLTPNPNPNPAQQRLDRLSVALGFKARKEMDADK